MRYCPPCREELKDWVTLYPDWKVPPVDKLPRPVESESEQKKHNE